VAWRRVHDLILWRDILGELGIGPGTTVRGPDLTPAAVRDLLPLLGARVELEEGARARPPNTDAGRRPPIAGSPLLARAAGRLRRLVGSTPMGSPAAARTDAVDADLARLAGWFGDERCRPLLVLGDATVHQTVEIDGSPRRIDPFLGPIVDRLAGTALDPVTFALERSSQPTPDARRVTTAVLARFEDPPRDDPRGSALATRAARILEDARATRDLDGVDIGPLLLGAELGFAREGIAPWVRARGRIQRFLTAHRPAGLLLINEYSRPEWLAAARALAIPVAAVQHGIIHPRHAGYVLPERSASLVLADRTYVFGGYERRLLTGSVYREDEVVVAGAPRLDLLRASAPGNPERARDAIRSAVGARAGERVVVVSSTNNPDVRRLVVAPALAAILDRSLPGVRLVVKLHPAEESHDLYERLAAGLAAAGGFAATPVSVVRDLDLFALLRAADAHLGIHSTVLTDAVVAGTRNLVVVGFPGSDALGYVASGVARPVRDGGELLAALDAPDEPGHAAARDAFLAEHFAPGEAADRIATDLLGWLGG